MLQLLLRNKNIQNLEGITGMTSNVTNPVIGLGTNDAYIREIGNVIYTPYEAYKYTIVYTGYITYDSRNVFAAGSNDLITWVKYNSGQPLFANKGEDPYIIYTGLKYYCFVENLEGVSTETEIRCYSADNIEGTWTDEGIVLSGTGVSGDWDEGAVASPIIYFENGTYYLIYEGAKVNFGGPFPFKIGIASSSNVLGPYNRIGNGILYDAVMSDNWGGNFVADDFIKINGTYYMTFHGSTISNPGVLASGIAKSNTVSSNFIDLTADALQSDLIGKTLNTAMFNKFGNGFFIYGSGDETGILFENITY